MSTIVGTLPAKHTVDPNGSLNIDVPIQLPPSNLDPGISFSYHSASQDMGDMGPGWVIRGLAVIERVGATKVQDGFLGSVNYDANDRFTLNGSRLMSIGNGQYRYEIEQWSKIVASGSDQSNPDYWTEYLPDGSYRVFGQTADSNIKAQGSTTATRVWALCEYVDAFTNHISYTYNNETNTGAYYISSIGYGGNNSLSMQHQRNVTFTYETRPDVFTRFVGGHKIYSDKRLASMTSSVNGGVVHTHTINYALAPLTARSRVQSISLSDASNAAVNPLTFNWNDAAPEVYQPVQTLNKITPGVSNPQMIPMDYDANGKTDVIVASSQINGNLDALYIDVYLSDGSGNLSHSTACSGTTGLDPPTQLLGVSANEYGRTDLLHILNVDSDANGNQAHVMTILLSTDAGFKPQTPFSFIPEVFDGKYFSGDFNGDGRVGLIYVYNSLDSNGIPALRMAQLALNGSTYTVVSTITIPGGMSLDSIQVVIGDFNGDGADDAYFIWSESGDSVAHIHLVQSASGILQYVGEVLDSASQPIEWYEDIGFTTHDVGDGLVGLLAVTSDLQGEIQLQAIRSTGKTLLALTAPQPTGIVYNGRINQARTTSTDTSDIVIMSQNESAGTVQIDVLHYNNDTFQRLAGVQQPTSAQFDYTLDSVDVRGTGRADCLFSLVDFEGNINLATLNTAGSPTADILSGYTNGLGATTTVTFAPLTDETVYTASEASATNPTAYTNALARNITSSIPLSPSGGFAATQVPGRSRTMLVHYPKYVVKDISTCAAPTRAPDVALTVSYIYKNARFAPDGRGWLGFESVTQQNQPEGTNITSTFSQEFPFLGQTTSIATTDTSGVSLNSTSYSWTASSPTTSNQSVQLASQVQSRYEGGTHAFDVTVQYQYDQYGNITSQTTSSSDTERPTCTVTTTYLNDENAWLLGRQTLRAVDPGDGATSQTKYGYAGNTPTPTTVSKLISGTSWSTQTFTYNAVGKETTVSGPGPAKATFTYDQTNAFRASETFFTGPSASYTNNCSYEYVTGQVSTVQDANGHITAMSYDVLGRPLTISEGETSSSLTVLQKYTYASDSNGAYHRNDTLTSWNADQWGYEIIYTDGLNQEWRKMTNSPEDPTVSVIQDMVLDGAGRVAQQSRTYRSGDTPVFATCTFDAQSRPLTKTSPSLDPNVSPITITYEYSYASGRTQITERQYSGSDSTPSQVSVRELQYYPNTAPDAGHEIVKALVVKQVDALSRTINVSFDGQLRATSATDPAGVQLAVTWDGLSRQTKRVITNGTQTISQFSMSFDDNNCQSTLNNDLTNSAAVTTYDYTKRPLIRAADDETVNLSYDAGGTNVISRLASVTSSTGVQHNYNYDTRGNLTDVTIGIDGRSFKTSYEWTPTKKVAQTTNPDGTSIARTFWDSTSFIKEMDILDPSQNTLLATTYSGFNNATFRPNVCTLGNGLVSSVTTADNGALTSSTLQNTSGVLHSQVWTLDSFSKIQQYSKAYNSESLTSQFSYDSGGQLLAANSTGSVTQSDSASTFTYDDSGNLSSLNSDVWVSDGWQLSSIKDASGKLTSTFKYSADGNLTEKMDGSGTTTTSMTYDSDGRLVQVNNASFVYDYQGRVLKATHSDGSISYYPNPEYDLLVKTTGDITSTAHVINGSRRGFLSTDTVAGTVQKPNARYVQTDHLGSVVAVSDDTGSVLTTYEYDAYGHTIVNGDDISRYKYGGKEDFEGLYYFGARFYDPELRRFVTLDNITVTLENITPQSFNQYTYSRNDPMNFVDVNGNVPWWHWLVGAVLIVVGAAITVATGGAASPLVFYAGAIIGGAILGAGTSALQSDLMAEVYNNGEIDDGAWLKSMAIGAAIGAVTGAAGGAFSKIVAPKIGGMILGRIASSSSKLFSYFKPFTKWAGTTLVEFGLKTGQQTGLSAVTAFAKSFAINEAFSVTVGVSSQLVKNAMAGEAWDYHLTGVLWMSAVTGFGGAVASGLTAGILKKVGTELVVHSSEGIFDVLAITGARVLNDTTRGLGWSTIFSSLNKL